MIIDIRITFFILSGN